MRVVSTLDPLQALRASADMREMQLLTGAIQGAGLGETVAPITDGRFSGASRGFVIGHIVPVAAKQGPSRPFAKTTRS